MADQEDIGTLLSKIAIDVADLKKGLTDGRNDLKSFKSFSTEISGQIKKALTFTIGILGVGALLGELKGLLAGVTEVGAKLETTKLATYAVGQNFGYTASQVDILVADLKKLKVSSTDGYEAVNQFISHGLDPRQLTSIAQAARDLAVAAGKSPQEMFSLLIDSIVTGTPRALRQAKIPIKEFQDTVLAEGKSLDDNLKLSSQERSQVMIDLIMKYAQTVEGVSNSTAGSYSRQLGQIKLMATQAKEVLWDFMQPLLTAITGEKIKVWSDLLGWLTANREELQKWGQTIGDFIRLVWGVIAAVVSWMVANGDLVKTFIELAVAYKVAGYITAIGAAIAGLIPKLIGVTALVTGLQAACSGPFAIVITVALAGLAIGINRIRELHSELDRLNQKNNQTKTPQITRPGEGIKLPGAAAAGIGPRGEISPELLKTLEAQGQTGVADETVTAAKKKYSDLMGDKPSGTAKGDKGGKDEPEEDLWGAYWKMLAQKRQAEIQDSQNSLDLLKSTNEKKRADLEKQLADGLLDGQAYYAKLQELQQGETAQALKLIESKNAAQAAAYKDALADIARQEMSPEMRGYRQYEEGQKNRLAMANLDAEAAKLKLDGEKKVTDELKRQVELKKEYQQKTQDLNLETAQLLGAISEQEATLQKLYYDWQRAKQKALADGADPAYLQALDKNLAAKQADAKYGGYAGAITQGLSSLMDSLMQGGQDLMKAANSIFKNLFQEALKPGLAQLKQLLVSGFKDLFGEAGTGIASAVMGVIGLLGMLLTSGGGKSSFTSSGVTSSVTAHEAVRGIIAGPTSIPIAEIGTSLADALVPTNGILLDIKALLAGGRGAAGSTGSSNLIQINAVSFDTLKQWLDKYFQDYLMHGAPA